MRWRYNMNCLKIIEKRKVFNKDFKIYGTLEEPLFIAKDVADWIDHSNTSSMLNSIDEDEKKLIQVGTLNNAYSAWFLTEDGVYEVLMQSRKPIAKKFKKKVKEILKSIRNHGAYMTPEKIEEALLNPDTIIQLATKLKEEQQARSEAEKQIQIMKPKAEFYDDVTESNHTLEMSLVAKTLNFKGVGRNKLFEILRSEGVLQRDNIPYQKYVDSGWFKTVETKFSKPTGDVGINIKTVVYQKGIAKISNTLKRLGYIQVKQNNI